MNIEIKCPFDIGDTVYINENKAKKVELECPFCHGKKYVDLYEEGYAQDKEQLVLTRVGWKKTKLTYRCNMCHNGIITYYSVAEPKKLKCKVTRVFSLDGMNYKDACFVCEDEYGKIHMVQGRDIFVSGEDFDKFNDVINDNNT